MLLFQELKRLREERAREQERAREEREVASMIKKHNHALQNNTSMNAASGSSCQPQMQQQSSKNKLNSSYTVSKPVLQQNGGSGSQDSDS